MFLILQKHMEAIRRPKKMQGQMQFEDVLSIKIMINKLYITSLSIILLILN